MERTALISSCNCHISSIDMASRLNFLLIRRLSGVLDSAVDYIDVTLCLSSANIDAEAGSELASVPHNQHGPKIFNQQLIP